ncbi:hypothetical protein K1T71_012467 [Dendrolimus kikuchii]|uniref:Uncharacterized protein n=1 Tax=Dendrolimus kikuchii TaxID=765133 RepID=A0ACC1CJE7_9NEOP|nr:hypothetical protein K1T71_012467 [Dendrolimus kikuchii]
MRLALSLNRNEHPWLAMVEFNKDGKEYLVCGGALISGRYVLTAAHCTNLDVVKAFGKPKLVRLGEYDVSHEGPDCVTVEAGGQDCTDGVTKINVESYTLHPAYDMVKRKNDIALLRLEEMAPFTEFIRPICLPTNDLILNPPEDLRLYVAGWGATETKLFSPTKLYVDLPYVPLEKCQTSYTKPPLQIQLWNLQLCAGGEPGKDACRGDSGGPLVYDSGQIFEAIGLVSFGPSQCSLEDVPGVYTNIYPYIDWILNTIIE